MDGSRFDSLARTLAISRRGALRALAGGAVTSPSGRGGRRRRPRTGSSAGRAASSAWGNRATTTSSAASTPRADGSTARRSSAGSADRWSTTGRTTPTTSASAASHRPTKPGMPGATSGGEVVRSGRHREPLHSAPSSEAARAASVSCQAAGGRHSSAARSRSAAGASAAPPDSPATPRPAAAAARSTEVNYPAGINRQPLPDLRRRSPTPAAGHPRRATRPAATTWIGVCCNGECCPPDKCCSLAGLCEECCGPGNGLANLGEGSCEPGCTIDGLVYAAGETNPAQECQICDPDVNPSAWTSRADNEICGPNGDRACCAGACCTDRGCCLPTDVGGRCDIEFCGGGDPCAGLDPCGCTIDGAFYEPDARNPANECESCNISVSTSAWSPKTLGSCGPNGDRFCDRGVCCELGICPNVTLDACAEYCDAVCVIGGILYYQGDRNPANSCLQCAPSASHTDWSYMPSNYYCDPVAQTGACCFGTCCGAGSWCNESGICEAFVS